jgi:hypothetical protein
MKCLQFVARVAWGNPRMGTEPLVRAPYQRLDLASKLIMHAVSVEFFGIGHCQGWQVILIESSERLIICCTSYLGK